MSSHFKAFLIITAIVSSLGYGFILGEAKGYEWGYAAGRFSMIQDCNGWVNTAYEKLNKCKEGK